MKQEERKTNSMKLDVRLLEAADDTGQRTGTKFH